MLRHVGSWSSVKKLWVMFCMEKVTGVLVVGHSRTIMTDTRQEIEGPKPHVRVKLFCPSPDRPSGPATARHCPHGISRRSFPDGWVIRTKEAQRLQ